MKSEDSISVKAGSYFPKTVRAIGAVFCIFGLGMIWTSPVIGLLFNFITGVIFTTHYGFEINRAPNSFRDFVWVLGWREGKKLPYKAVEFLFIQPGKFTYLTYGLRERTLPAHEGYIKFDGRNEVQVLTEVNKEKLILKLKKIAEALNVPIKDYSSGNPVTLFEPDSKE